MKIKNLEKVEAIKLRKVGLSYKEILEKIPVAKSSLSLWLKNVKLSINQRQRLVDKKLASALRGAKKVKDMRIARTKFIKEKSGKEVGKLSKRELWLVGVALYWAEGSKEKEYHPGSGVKFSNLDSRMIKIFLKWLLEVIKIDRDSINFEIMLHENNKHRVGEVVDYWSKQTHFSRQKFKQVYFKKNKIKTKRKNIGANYFGLLRVKVKRSSILNRKIQGWIEGIFKNIKYSGVV